MRVQLFQVLHLFSVVMLVGITFAALAAPRPENRRRSLMWSGTFAVLAFVSGFGLLGIMRLGVPGWAIVKIACWLALAVMTGLAFRRPAQIASWERVTVVAVLIAVAMVTFRPF